MQTEEYLRYLRKKSRFAQCVMMFCGMVMLYAMYDVITFWHTGAWLLPPQLAIFLGIAALGLLWVARMSVTACIKYAEQVALRERTNA